MIWWCYASFHFLCGLAMALREMNDTAGHNWAYETVMNLINIAQIGLLCKTMQQIFVDEEAIYSTCLAGQATNEMPLNYQKFQIWLVIEAGMIMSIFLTNMLFLFLRALLPQKGTLSMPTISNTHTEETDYIVAHQFMIGYMNNLTVPLFLGLIVVEMAYRDKSTNINTSDNPAIFTLEKSFFWMQIVQFISAYVFVFVSIHKGPTWWC